ncbi:hypothetical protein N7505_006608 [Penicillium chrysogenum]|uniref:Uncharacterized protein n=1 Tax=Penicillium chrysogenum TaxID=5076 RepID=A0ABQ8WLG2_PENCH|nr:hypothetical protein N7505_006608 [Penicillium chrysogenum]
MPFEPFKRERDGAKAFLERMRNGVSNNEILAELLDKESNIFTDHVYELPKAQMTKARLPDVAKYELQLHASFNKPDLNADYSGHSSVYLVGQPNRWARRLSRTPKPCHWSIYSEGHFYHLKLEDGAQGSSIVLRDEPQREWKALSGPFIAYHIGVTDYYPDEISLLAKWVITQMNHDTLSTAAYEQFVFGLAIRILRGPSNTTAFIGNFWQIMEHDIGCRRQALAPNGFLTGVQLAGPEEDISTWLKRWYLIYRIETDARGLDLCWRKGTKGQINWKAHEFHPFIRPFAVGPPAIANVLAKVGQRIPLLSKAVPPKHRKKMPMMAVYRRKKGAPLPRDLMLKHYYASLFSIHIRPGCNMSDKDFWFQVNDYLNSGCVEHITFNRGFSYKFIFGPEIIGSVRFVRYREPPAEEVLHSSSSTIVEKECLESESTIDAEQSTGECIYPPDTLATNIFEHKGVPCQVLIDMAETFKSPVEI